MLIINYLSGAQLKSTVNRSANWQHWVMDLQPTTNRSIHANSHIHLHNTLLNIAHIYRSHIINIRKNNNGFVDANSQKNSISPNTKIALRSLAKTKIVPLALPQYKNCTSLHPPIQM